MEKIRSNSWENLTQYYLLTCHIVVNLVVWEIGRGKLAAGQSRVLGRVMWTKFLPPYTVQPMEAASRNSDEIICKHRKLCFQVPGKVFRESGRTGYTPARGNFLISIDIFKISVLFTKVNKFQMWFLKLQVELTPPKLGKCALPWWYQVKMKMLTDMLFSK